MVFLVALISGITIWIISIYLAQNWAVSRWLSFRTSDLNAWYLLLCEQTAEVDRSHYNINLSHHKLIRNFNIFRPYKCSKFSDRMYTCIVNNCYTDTHVSFGNTHNSHQPIKQSIKYAVCPCLAVVHVQRFSIYQWPCADPESFFRGVQLKAFIKWILKIGQPW